MDIIQDALNEGKTGLSEYDAKQVLSRYGIPVTREIQATSIEALLKAAGEIGYPVVLKGCSETIAHKTEKGLVRIDIRDDAGLMAAYEEMRAGVDEAGGMFLVQEMISEPRELVAGLVRDPQFGPCVMFGIGGIFTEIMADVSFCVAPLTRRDAMGLIDDFRGKRILEGIRGMPEVDREALAGMLIAIGQIGIDHDAVQEIDVNPLKIKEGKPIAVDALIVLSKSVQSLSA